MGEHYRARRMSELMMRYVPADLPKGRHGVRDRETGQLLDQADYDSESLARAKCRQQAAADIEKLFIADRASAIERIAHLIAVSVANPASGAERILDYLDEVKA